MDCNSKPIISGTDNAIWSRVGLVPFEVEIPAGEIDSDLPEKLRDELPGILAWAVRGCLDWQRDGFAVPEEVRQATQDYRIEMDVWGRFIDECCEIGPYFSARSKNLYARYLKWCEESGEPKEKILNVTSFGLRLRKKGFTKDHDNEGNIWSGVGLKRIQ